MKLKKLVSIFTLFLISFGMVFAHGKKDIEEIQVDNLQSWQEKIDLEAKTKKKAVKYNIMVTATDLGGNQAIEGPFNLYVDPESDKPVSGITNPYYDMRVVGNLNIVGTCVDDDAVARVVLILDEGKVDSEGRSIEKTVNAKGKEFWSYYLDTNDLEEGPHTIKVIGYDINGLEGNPYVLQWQLDRKQPVTEVDNMTMGQLVSGNVNFKGQVSDGNGIKELYYSTDSGNIFVPVKVSNAKTDNKQKVKNAIVDFSFSIDTRKFEDGAAVVWFKAVDESGSVGYYSFLYFIDNTNPEVTIVYPGNNDTVNGKFTVAGYAKDKMGMSNLSWSFGDQHGEFELIPGNPYWAVTVDAVNSKDKSKKFVVRGEDTAGNVVEVTKNISLDPEGDKPVVTITEPANGQVFTGNNEPVFVRGYITDDDNVVKVKVQLDGKAPEEIATKGGFSYTFCEASELSAGSHKITVVGYDQYGTASNPATISFDSKGIAPTFDRVTMNGQNFENGMEVHPESGSVFEVQINAQLGLKQVHTEMTWGKDGLQGNTVELKNAGSYKVSIPVPANAPRGVMNVEIKAIDSLDRISEYRGFFHVTDVAKIKNDELKLVFDDSVFVEKDGVLEVINNKEFPATGYVLGGNATSVEIVPDTRFARARLAGNQIVLEAGSATGASSPVRIRVRTDRNGRVLESKPIIFKNDTATPVFGAIRANGTRVTDKPVDGRNGAVRITGSVACETGVASLKYKLLMALAEVNPATGVVSKVTNSIEDEYQNVRLSGGEFSLSVDPSEYGTGMFLVELLAESSGGNKKAAAVLVNNIPDTEAVPKFNISWLKGFDLYAVPVYQGELEKGFEAFAVADMTYGANSKEYSITVDGKPVVSKSPTVTKEYTMSAHFATVDNAQYRSGMTVAIPYASKKIDHYITLNIDTAAAISGVNYEIYGDKVPGGDEKQSGAAKVTKEGDRYIAEIPLNNLPARVTHIKATIKSPAFKDTVETATVFVVREAEEETDDAEKIYTLADGGTIYDSVEGNYVFTEGSEFLFYVNIPTTFKAELVSSTSGLNIETRDHLVVLTATKDGNYRGVRLRVTDPYGRVFESRSLNFLADSEGPSLVVQNTEAISWVKRTLSLRGTAQDALGVRSVEYSLDNGANWSRFSITPGRGVTFSRDIDLSSFDDGLIKINIRATDNAEHVAYLNLACLKDTKAPEVTVIEPLEGDIVNGETLVVFKVDDDGYFDKAEYTLAGRRNKLEVEPLVSTYVGTPEQPNDPRMSFVFTDDAGNATTVSSWAFKVDSKTDLPVTEIHIPEENEVLTRDFKISGVVFDDDGDSQIFYRIDNGPYRQVSEDEVYGATNPDPEYRLRSNYEITVPLSEMTDNEHTVTVYAVDSNGVRGEETKRKFRISLEEPKGSVEKPTIDISVKDVIEITGVASDKNGIQKVEISLDNGNSYNDAVGRENWSYKVDTRAIPGGTQVVFLRITDRYGITGLYSSLINIDNNAPDVSLELPLDDSTSTGQLFFSGHAYDNVEITNMYVTIRNMERTSSSVTKKLKIDRIIGETMDISDLPNGFYNVELTAEDKAGNRTNVSRNIHLDKNKPNATVDILYPLNGEHKNGYFNIYGQAECQPEIKVKSLKLYVDNKQVKETELSSSGFFKFEITPPSANKEDEVDENGVPIRNAVDMTDGTHSYKVVAELENGKRVTSREQTVVYSHSGTWITLDNFTYGDFATERPYLKGKAGYILSDEEEAILNAKDTSKEVKQLYNNKKVVDKIEISFDNGKTFELLSNKSKWQYRVENQDLTEGYHFMLVRVTMKSGERAIERTIVQIDNTKPSIRLIAPGRGGRYNQELDVSGLSSDNVLLKDVTVTFRKGDKSAYEVPAFIQGLYLDVHFWGATLFDVGAGLTFFDDNVKLQFQWGQFTQNQRNAVNNMFNLPETDMRYGGDNVIGMKLLANISAIPFSYFFGHDYDWLYANFALGAQFSRFNETGSGKPQWLSAILGQIEFPKVVRKKASAFSSFSFYTEVSVWFIPSDVSGDKINSIVPQIGIGLRTNVF
ncbi:MAG: Ig-like domain-containing protein [Treponema sp.]|nr:Ig-like domain-containing protein [Treponema sp.]